MTIADADVLGDGGIFIVQADLLPSYIPMRVASQILFVGESVLMFETNQQNSKQQSGKFMLQL
jgi:gamma-tubulin complex component 4